MIFDALSLSDKFKLDYWEIDENNRKIPINYDFFAFNYHPYTMGWLNTRKIKKLPGLKMTFVLEVSPNDPFILCPQYDFDIYCVLDPTIKTTDKRVYAFPRPLELPQKKYEYRDQGIPVIGSFGFATPGKGFELVVDAVNKEFDRAIIRINIPCGTYADNATWKLHRRNYVEYLSDLCYKLTKKGIEIKISHEYLTKSELIEWCAQNTLNCFLYNRNQPGLSATTDQAITSGRPLAISTNETFRHIHPYISPYPFQTLRESIENSRSNVLDMQRDWAPINFTHTFERLLDDQGKNFMDRQIDNETIVLERKSKWSGLYKRGIRILSHLKNPSTISLIKSTYSIPASEIPEKKILIISHNQKHCGIYQYGLNIAGALRKSNRYRFIYCECSNGQDLAEVITKFNPQAIIYNYYPLTMPWLTPQITRLYSIPQLCIMHEVTQDEADSATNEMFDFHLCPDPTLIERNPATIKTKRLIPSYINVTSLPEIPTIGSFGFGFEDKGFERLIEIVQREFNIANINILMPFHDIIDKNGKQHALATAKRCRSLIKKPGINLQINHNFLSKQALLDFLAANTINAFFYDTTKSRGISSTIEHALAVQRPLAINKCGMFRHIVNASPSICIEDNCIKEIINNDIVPLVPFYNEWSEDQFVIDYERIIDQILNKANT